MSKKEIYTFGIDFDGTAVTHEYPKVGQDIGAADVLKQLTDKGHKIVINTMRSGSGLMDAKEWFDQNNIPLYGVNCNPTQKSWTQSPKVYADIYIDDAALGVPLVHDKHRKPFVNWYEVAVILFKEFGIEIDIDYEGIQKRLDNISY